MTVHDHLLQACATALGIVVLDIVAPGILVVGLYLDMVTEPKHLSGWCLQQGALANQSDYSRMCAVFYFESSPYCQGTQTAIHELEHMSYWPFRVFDAVSCLKSR